MLTFPLIDPVALSIGPIKIYWYALAYIAGFLFAVFYSKLLLKKYPNGVDTKFFENLVLGPALIGIIIGGRLGHVLFYDFEHYLHHPLEILMTWKGGMSFHGGLIGAIFATLLTSQKNNLNPWKVLDIAAVVTPVGIGLGRITNFINGELYGMPTDVKWGMIFPHAGDMPRHPTQLYEAALEGLVLFEIMRICFTNEKLRNKPGVISALFLIIYGVFRFGTEFFKDPVAQGGAGFGPLTQGHLLCLPMILFGIWLYFKMNNNAHTLSTKPQSQD